MCADLLLSHPTPENVHIIPTARASSGLALSSRNSYLSDGELPFAVTLYQALVEGGKAWASGLDRDSAVERAEELVKRKQEQAAAAHVDLKLDYVDVNDSETFEVVAGKGGKNPVILSGALWVGKTRLIDNIVLGDTSGILC
jgi:pantoate--beta-alanine ligase